nr:putative holin [uncultured Aquitalea sp.]
MSEPVSSGGAAVMTGVLGVASLLPGINAAVLFGAFAGGVVFVLSAREMGWAERAVYLLISILVGVLCAHMVAGVIDSLLPQAVEVPDAAGALVSAAVAVRGLQWAIRRAQDPEALIKGVGNGRDA